MNDITWGSTNNMRFFPLMRIICMGDDESVKLTPPFYIYPPFKEKKK